MHKKIEKLVINEGCSALSHFLPVATSYLDGVIPNQIKTISEMAHVDI